MPFDAASPTQHSDTEVFRDRRERAAALWRGVPQREFDMQSWVCGTMACALGWLALHQFDGWWMNTGTGGGNYPTRFGRVYQPYVEAARYFGLTTETAELCFGPDYESAKFHNCYHICAVTPSDVADTLLRLPYTVAAG